MADLTPELLRELISYDPDTGSMIWLPRRPDHFGYLGAKALRYFKTWNSRFLGKDAFTSRCGNGYNQATILGQKTLAHRVAWAIAHGRWPVQIDHINGDRSDNRLCNLREVSQAENCLNLALRKKNRVGTNGVRWTKNRWQATITVNKKRVHLGRFANLEDAIRVRREAEARYGFHPNHGRRA